MSENTNYLASHINTSTVCRMVACLLCRENQETPTMNLHVGKHIISLDFDKSNRLYSTKEKKIILLDFVIILIILSIAFVLQVKRFT